MSERDFAIRLAAALLLGCAVGVERQWRQRQAGLRTNALVATGACAFVTLPPLLGVPRDTGLAAYVIAGIGFLAGGVIYRERGGVSGLNTAATLWCTAAVGVLCGNGFILDAAIVTAAVLAVHLVLRPIIAAINARPAGDEELHRYEIRARARDDAEDRVRAVLIDAARAAHLTLLSLASDDVDGGRVDIVAEASITGAGEPRLERIVTRLGKETGVVAVSWSTLDETELLPAEG